MKKVLVTGKFSVIHPGHIRLFRLAKELKSKLFIGVEPDNKFDNKININEQYRLENVQSLACVDLAFIMNKSVGETIREIKPDYVIKGKEHEASFNEEVSYLKEHGGKLIFSSGGIEFSSLDLIGDVRLVEDSHIKIPYEYLKRNDISVVSLVKICKKIQNLNMIVLGETIVDEYISCKILGLSQEEPSVVVTPLTSKLYVGGAGIVAAHAAGLNANVDFFTILKNDKAGKFAKSKLKEFNVRVNLFIDNNRPTILKQRYKYSNKSLFKISYLHQDEISIKIQNTIINEIIKKIEKSDLVVFSDFNYGLITKYMLNSIFNSVQNKTIIKSADSQSSSQIGDILRYRDMDLLTATEHEARSALRNKNDGLVVLCDKLNEVTNAKYILLKLGDEGVLIQNYSNKSEKLTDLLPSFNKSPIDTSGAGDSMLILTSLAIASGANIWEASFLGSIAAALQVSTIGNTPLKIEMILDELHKINQ